MKLVENFYRHVLIPAFETTWHRRSVFQRLEALEQSQWFDRETHEQRQLEALGKLLNYASLYCPYYRDVWREQGLQASDVASLEDFTAWPVIDRDTIREQRLRMRAELPGMQLIHKSTGGSSGVPLQFDLDWSSNDAKMAAWHRGYGWAGAALGTKQFYLWGGQIQKQSWHKSWKDSLYHGIYRRKMASAFHMSEENAGRYLQAMNRYRPDVVVAYVNPLYELSRLLKAQGLRPIRPRTIVVGAEKLHSYQRQVIEDVFQAPVFETYGSREFTLIAAECPEHSGMHMTMENLLVEILDDDGIPTPAGEEGNVVITDLTNYGMPFIRYRNGDRAIAGWASCKCGRGLPLLRAVVGRQLDIIHTPDGRRVPGEFFPHLLKDAAAVRRFQVVQQSSGDVVLKVIVSGDWNPAERANIHDACAKVLGPSVRFVIDEVHDIPLTAAGKHRIVISHRVQQANLAV